MYKGIDLLRAAFYRPQRKDYLGFGVLLIFTLLAYFFVPVFLVGLLAVVALVVLSKRLDIGLYIFALFSFCTNWQMTITTESLRDLISLPLPAVMIIPMNDLAAMILGVTLVLALLFGWIRGQKNMLSTLAPHLAAYCLFLIWAGISAVHVFDHNLAASFKYVLRPMLFAYLLFVVMPYLIIQKRTVLYGLFATWTLLGFGIAVYGASSLFVVANDGWPRVVPYPIFGTTPFGVNHNLLAEPLVALVPISIFMAILAWKKRSAWFPLLRIVSIFMIVITLLTLSRAAWLALVVEAVIFGYYNRAMVQMWWKRLMTRRWLVGVALVPIVAYMGLFLSSSIVSSSNESRQTMIDIVRYYVQRSPWVGFGPGSFIAMMSETKVFVIEYGDPLDAHGFIQKILLENGVVGLALFGIFLWTVFRAIAKQQKRSDTVPSYLGHCVFMMAAGAVVFQVFNTSYFLSTMWLPLGVALTSVRLLQEKEIV